MSVTIASGDARVAHVGATERSDPFSWLAVHVTYLMLGLVTVQRSDLVPLSIDIGSMRLSEILAVGVIALAVVGRITTPQRRLVLPRAVLVLLGLFLGVMMISTLMSANIDCGPNVYAYIRRPAREVPYIKSLTAIISSMFGVAVFTAVVMTVTTPERFRRALRWWIGGGVVCSIVAIYSAPAAMFHWPLGGVIGVSWREAGAVSDSLMPRVYGLTGEPRHFVSFLVSMLPVLIIMTMSGVYVFSPVVQKILLTLCCAAYSLTLARSTMVFGLVMLLLLVILLSVTRRGLSIKRLAAMASKIAGAVIAFATLLALFLRWFNLPNIIDVARTQWSSMYNEQNLSNYFQMIGWRLAWRAFVDHPLLGVGIGNLSFYVDRYIEAKPEWLPAEQYVIVTPVNNLYLDILAEMGILGLLSFLAFIFYLAWLAYRYTRRAAAPIRSVLLGLLGGLLMLLVAYVVFSAFFFAYVWAYIGLLTVACALNRRDPGRFARVLVHRRA